MGKVKEKRGKNKKYAVLYAFGFILGNGKFGISEPRPQIFLPHYEPIRLAEFRGYEEVASNPTIKKGVFELVGHDKHRLNYYRYDFIKLE